MVQPRTFSLLAPEMRCAAQICCADLFNLGRATRSTQQNRSSQSIYLVEWVCERIQSNKWIKKLPGSQQVPVHVGIPTGSKVPADWNRNLFFVPFVVWWFSLGFRTADVMPSLEKIVQWNYLMSTVRPHLHVQYGSWPFKIHEIEFRVYFLFRL